jgi:putative membrane protein
MSEQTRRHIVHWIGVALFVSCFAGVLLFGRSISSSAQSAAAADTHFAHSAAQGGMAEVKLGELAQEKAGSEAVNSFGKRMVDDHRKAAEKLKATAQSENINLPSELKPADQAAYDRLSKLSGTEFDRAYMQMMVEDGEEDVAEFKKQASSGSNQALKDFAIQTLPTLQEHLKEARDVAANRKASLQ